MKRDRYFCPEQVLPLLCPQSRMLQTDKLGWDTMSRGQIVGEKDHLSLG